MFPRLTSSGFLINLPAGVAFAIPLLFLKIPSRHNQLDAQSAFSFMVHKLDIVGFFLLAPAATMLLLALQYGATCCPWNSPRVIGLFCGALVALIIFLWDGSTKGEDALLPIWMITRRVLWCSCLVMVFSVATSFCASYFLPVYFQTVRGVSPIMSGVWLLPTILSQLIAAAVSGILGKDSIPEELWFAMSNDGTVSKTGYYLPWSVAAGVFLSIGSGLISTYSATTPEAKWIGYQTILGTGRGMGMQMVSFSCPVIPIPAELC